MLRFIDLFAGIGGMRIAFENAGCRCVFSSEWDKNCRITYKANFEGEIGGDITEIDENSVSDHDILVAGFPCQPFSIIGDGKGFDDTRGTLFFDIARILEAKRPAALLLENVKRLTSHDNGKTFNVILGVLEKLGYHAHYKTLNALDFGLPQKRERIIIVGFRKNCKFNFPTRGTYVKGLDDILEPERDVDKKRFLSERIRERFRLKVGKLPRGSSIWHENKSGDISAHRYSCALRAGASHNYLSVNGKRRLTPREMLRLQGFPETFKIVVSYSAIKRQAGNSAPIPMIEQTAREMVRILKDGRF